MIRKKILCTHHGFPPYLQYVATLLCEGWKSKNVAEFASW